MKKNLKFKFFIFDLDGVLFDSKKNMKKSWNSVKKNIKLIVVLRVILIKLGHHLIKFL